MGLPDEINLVLEDDDVLQAHDLHGSQMLRGLRLRAGLIGSNQQKSSIHDCCTIQHGSHENVMPCNNKGMSGCLLLQGILLIGSTSFFAFLL